MKNGYIMYKLSSHICCTYCWRKCIETRMSSVLTVGLPLLVVEIHGDGDLYTATFCVSKQVFSQAQSAVFCFPKKVFLQLSSEQFVGDVWIVQLDSKRVPQARYSSCKSSVAVTAVCLRHHASRNVSWPQRERSAVEHEAAIICQLERHLPRQRLANQTCDFELDMLLDG